MARSQPTDEQVGRKNMRASAMITLKEPSGLTNLLFPVQVGQLACYIDSAGRVEIGR